MRAHFSVRRTGQAGRLLRAALEATRGLVPSLYYIVGHAPLPTGSGAKGAQKRAPACASKRHASQFSVTAEGVFYFPVIIAILLMGAHYDRVLSSLPDSWPRGVVTGQQNYSSNVSSQSIVSSLTFEVSQAEVSQQARGTQDG